MVTFDNSYMSLFIKKNIRKEFRGYLIIVKRCYDSRKIEELLNVMPYRSKSVNLTRSEQHGTLVQI